jgi:aminoglycoside 6'-N-acetyltransferase I
MHVRPAEESDRAPWLAMRRTLWPDPDYSLEEFQEQITDFIARGVAFIALEDDVPIGFAEVSLRPYAEGCKSSPVAFLEGWFVLESHRGRGVGRALLERVERWGREQGCTELGSDTWLDNIDSQRAHEQLGFEEVERLVSFRKSLE